MSEDEEIGYQQMLDELAATGYTGTELGDWGYMPTDPESLQSELDHRGISMVGAFVPVALKDPSAHENGEQRALRVARLLAQVGDEEDQPFLILSDDNGTNRIRTQLAGRVTSDMGLDPAEWDTFARGATRIARAVRDETGVPTAFHHHCAGYVETPAEIEQFLARTDSDLIGLVLDTGHYAYGAGTGGCEALDKATDRFGKRIWHVHFKDCDPEVAQEARRKEFGYFEAVRRGVFCELGKGCVDFPSVLSDLRSLGYSGWIVVEQDVLPGMGEPRESARRNREYLEKIGLPMPGERASDA